MSGAFTVLRLPSLDVAHVETMNTDAYIEDEHSVEQYLRAFDHLCNLALSPAKSDSFLQGPTIALTPETWLTLLNHVRAGALTPHKLGAPTPIANHLLIGHDGEHITVEDHNTPAIHYTLDEWHAFLDGTTHDGEFTLPWLLGTPANA